MTHGTFVPKLGLHGLHISWLISIQLIDNQYFVLKFNKIMLTHFFLLALVCKVEFTLIVGDTCDMSLQNNP